MSEQPNYELVNRQARLGLNLVGEWMSNTRDLPEHVRDNLIGLTALGVVDVVGVLKSGRDDGLSTLFFSLLLTAYNMGRADGQ